MIFLFFFYKINVDTTSVFFFLLFINSQLFLLSTTSLSFSNSFLFILELLCIFHAHKILNFLTKNLNTIWPKFCFFFIIFINPLKIGLKKKLMFWIQLDWSQEKTGNRRTSFLSFFLFESIVYIQYLIVLERHMIFIIESISGPLVMQIKWNDKICRKVVLSQRRKTSVLFRTWYELYGYLNLILFSDFFLITNKLKQL